MSKEAMKLALEAFIAAGFGNSTDFALQSKAYDLAIEALAKQEQDVPEVCFGNIKQEQGEPVALAEYDAGLLNDYGGGNVHWWWEYIRYKLGRAHDHYQEQIDNLYTTPQQRTWVGLTDEEMNQWIEEEHDVLRWAEAKLKEKNDKK